MKGRRVALLLTGLWPLLAKDDVPATETNVTIEDHDLRSQDDALQQLPKLPLHVMTSKNPSNIVIVDPVFDVDDIEDYIEEDDLIDDARIHDREEQHVETTRIQEEAVHDESQTGSTKEEPISDEQDAATQADEMIEEASRDEPETTESSEAPPQDDEASTLEESESPDLSDVQTDEAAEDESNKSSNDTTAESESADAQDNRTEATVDATEEDEESDVADRVLVDYASKSAGALILEKSPAMKGTSNLLNGDNDKYAIVPCAEKKFVVINLSEDILVKQVKLANYERYSSHLKDFQIMGSQTMGEWVDLGTYTAEPGNGEQAFDLKEPAWARYLKFRFLTHHGSEHYCTYSQIKVHGSTMLQGFHEQWDPQDDELEEGSKDGAANDDPAEGAEPVEASGSDATSSEGESATETKLGESEDKVVENENSTEAVVDGTQSESTTDDETGSQDDVDAVVENDSEDAPSVVDETEDTKQAKSEDDSTVSANTEGIDDEEPASDKAGSLEVDNEDSKECQKPTLSTASIPVSCHDAIVSDRSSSIEQLDTSAIKPVEKSLKAVVTSVVKEMATAEAIMSFKDAQSVSDEVKDIQESLETTGRMPRANSVDTEANERKELDSTVEADEPAEQKQGEVSSEGTEEARDAPKNDSDVVATDSESVEKTAEEGRVDEPAAEGSAPPEKDDTQHSAAADKTGEEGHATTRNTETSRLTEKNNPVDIDPMLPNIVSRFPSAACMEKLDYQDFKAKIASKTNTQGGHPSGHGGKMEPIFKLLTDEIKILQTSQSVQDQYMKALISCYQQVMIEIASALSHVETRQEQRLSDLEKAMDATRSGGFASVIGFASGVISTCIVGVRWLYLAITTNREVFVAAGLVDDRITPFLILGASSFCLLAMGYCICAIRLKRSMKARPSPNGEVLPKPDEIHTEKTENTKEDQNKLPKHVPVVKETLGPLAPDVVQSENESDDSDRVPVPVINLAPRTKKRPTEEPTLVPID